MGETSALISPSLQPTSPSDFQPSIGLVWLANICVGCHVATSSIPTQPLEKNDKANKRHRRIRFIFMWHRVGARGQPAHTPLRTVRESFPSHGSSLSKDAPARGIPAI